MNKIPKYQLQIHFAQKNNGFYYFKTQKSKFGNERKTNKLI